MQDLANTACAFVTLGQSDDKLFAALATAAWRRAIQLNAQEQRSVSIRDARAVQQEDVYDICEHSQAAGERLQAAGPV